MKKVILLPLLVLASCTLNLDKQNNKADSTQVDTTADNAVPQLMSKDSLKSDTVSMRVLPPKPPLGPCCWPPPCICK